MCTCVCLSFFFVFVCLSLRFVLRLRLIKEKANEANLLTASVCMCFVWCVYYLFRISEQFSNLSLCKLLFFSVATIQFTREVFKLKKHDTFQSLT